MSGAATASWLGGRAARGFLLAFLLVLPWLPLSWAGGGSGVLVEAVRTPFLLSLVVIVYSSLRVTALAGRPGRYMELMFLLFVYLFFGVAPFLKSALNSWLYPFSAVAGERVPLLILLWLLMVELGLRIPFRRTGGDLPLERPWRRGVPLRADLLLMASLALGAGLVAWLGWGAFMVRGMRIAATEEVLGGNRMVSLLIFRFLTVFVGGLAVAWWMYFPWRRSGWGARLKGILLTATALLLNNPLAVSRHMAFIIVVALIIYALRWSRKGLPLLLGITFVGLPVSQVMHQLRHVKTSGAEVEMSLDMLDYFISAAFDAYESFLHVLDYVAVMGLSLGQQLMGALFFFVPRSLWPAKPVGSGYTVYQWLSGETGIYFLNASCPAPAEAYLNFGLPGMMAAGVLLGWFFRRLDHRYRRLAAGRPSSEARHPLEMVYPLLPGSLFFILRGDLMSSFAFVTAMALAFWLAWLGAGRPIDRGGVPC